MDKHYKGQQIRDQVKLLQGRDATDAKKSDADKGGTKDETTKSDEKANNEKGSKDKPSEANEKGGSTTKTNGDAK